MCNKISRFLAVDCVLGKGCGYRRDKGYNQNIKQASPDTLKRIFLKIGNGNNCYKSIEKRKIYRRLVKEGADCISCNGRTDCRKKHSADCRYTNSADSIKIKGNL